MFEAMSAVDGIYHSCRQVGEDRFQRIAGAQNIRKSEKGDNETVTYDLSTAQKVSSSTLPPRSMYHRRRVSAITAW